MVGAARTIWQTTVDEMPVRIDIKNRSAAATDLLKSMRAWDAPRSIKSATNNISAAALMQPTTYSHDPKVHQLVIVSDHRKVDNLGWVIAAVGWRATLTPGSKHTAS